MKDERLDIPAPGNSEPCDVCLKSCPVEPYLTVSLSGRLVARVCACPACGFRQVRPRLTQDELTALYGAAYFDTNADGGFRSYALQQQREEREAYFLARRIRKGGPSRGRLLEVGCALGFMAEALARFTAWDVEGLDVSAFAAYFARRHWGLTVTCSTLEAAAFPDGTFDFIVQKDVVEHVLDPRAHLVETARILAKGGRTYVLVPNGEANLRPLVDLDARMRASGEDALPLMTQGHLSFFSRDQFTRLAADCGLRVESFRAQDVTGGLRALGWIRWKRKKLQHRVARAKAAVPAPSTGREKDRFGELFDGIVSELGDAWRPHRSRPAYFWFRHLTRSINTLPWHLPWGKNFAFLLRKE